MDTNDKKTIEELRNALKPLDESVPLPDSLSADRIRAALDGEPKKKKVYKWQRPVAWVAAAAVFICCGITLFRYMGDSPLTESPPQEDSDTETHIALTDNVPLAGASAPAENGETFRMAGETYDSILSLAKDYAGEQTSYSLDLYRYKSASTREEAVAEAPMADGADMAIAEDAEVGTGGINTAASTASEDHAQTNLQVDGVDEADMIKNDGEYIYMLRDGRVCIIDATPADSMTLVYTLALPADEPAETPAEDGDAAVAYSYAGYREGWVHDMFLYDNLLVLLTTTYSFRESGTTGAQTIAYIYDVTDKAAPVQVQRFGQDGSYVSSRIAGGRLLLVTTYGDFYTYSYGRIRTTCKVDEEYLIPKTYVDGAGEAVAEEALAVIDTEAPREFTIASVKDLNDLTAPASTKAVLGGGGSELYCTADSLFVANTVWSWSDDLTTLDIGIAAEEFSVATEIFGFSFADGSIRHTASGCVPGRPLNQFSMDYNDGYFRIAVTNDNANALFVLDGSLRTVGSVEGFAEGESIRSVRFIGNTGYVVTFEQTDPLFVIDLTDPANPVIKGEVKLPGFSAYLHPAGESLLLGIGYGGTEEGLDGSAKVSLFDVSDPANPREIHSLVVADADFNSEAHAFVSVSDGSFLLPLTRYESRETENEYGTYIDYRYTGGALRLRVEDGKIILLNEYTCETEANRATYIGNTVYLLSFWHETAVTAFAMDTAAPLGSLTIPNTEELAYKEAEVYPGVLETTVE